MKLNSKIFIVMLAGLFITILVVGFFSFIFLRSSLQESISSNQLQVAQTTMEQIDRILHTRLLGIQVVANGPELDEFLSGDASNFSDSVESEVLTRLRSLRTLTGPWDVLWILDTRGQIMLSSRTKETGTTLTDPSVTAIFEAALEGTVTHSDFLIIGDTGRKTVIFASPIRSHDSQETPIIGVAIGHFSWPTILQILESLELHAVLLNNEGEVIAANTRYAIEDLIGRNYHSNSLISPLLSGTSFSLVVEGEEGFIKRSMLASLAPQLGFLRYQGSGWGLVLETPTDVAFAPATRKALQLVGIIALLFTSIIGVIVLFMRRLVVRPVVSLTHTARDIAAGDLKKRAVVTSGDEIGQLGKTFNFMTGKLQKSQDLLKKQIEELRELDRLKDNFLNNTTHELKTPLIPIKSQSQLLLAEDYGKLNQDQKQAVGMILRNETHLEGLVRDVVDISKLRSKKLKFFFKEADLAEIIEGAIKDMQELAKERGIGLILKPVPELPKLQLDTKRITQVIDNLLNNALKFTPEGGMVTVTVDKADKEVITTVKDTGIGMSKETLKKLFTPFFQADSDATRKYPGTGLGLSICRGFIEAHGGTIRAESEGKGKGSMVVFTLSVQFNVSVI